MKSLLPSSMPMPDLARRHALLAMLAATPAGALLAGCGAAESAPRFSYTLLDGSRHDSGALLGQVVLVNFWATTCAVCVKEMPQFVATHERFQGQGLQTLAVAMRHDAPARVADFAASRRLPFGVVIDNLGAVAAAFGRVEVTPTTLLIDRRSRIAWRHEGEPGFPSLQQRISKLLAEAA